ncbi:Protein kinase, AMP-activated, beta [Podochytrium sp. JEL0797]|nr:Protein kinase, AMP-activated, beta [Podochytrium sp. JEL0797]
MGNAESVPASNSPPRHSRPSSSSSSHTAPQPTLPIAIAASQTKRRASQSPEHSVDGTKLDANNNNNNNNNNNYNNNYTATQANVASLFGNMSVSQNTHEPMHLVVANPDDAMHEDDDVLMKELHSKNFLNSARIVHNYGVGGIAPLAPLSQKKDDKSVIPVMVSWTGGGRVVHITGTFNNWKQKIRLTKSKSDFSTVIDMPAGDTHRFKFIVDDEWKCSEDLPIASDSEGNLVNYLEVLDEFGDQIHDGFDNLAHDDTVVSPLGESPESSYTSQIPPYLNWHIDHQPPAVLSTTPTSAHHPHSAPSSPPPLPTTAPPLLPPHLEKVFLNAPVPVTSHRDDNLILPVPSSVTLNHLYACSIRDGVMALSTTTRYKQKYVTTILYKPVGHIYTLLLSDYGLVGDIPPAIGDFPELITLDLSLNKLTSIPEEIGKLAKLNYLYLYENEIGGEIPRSIGELKELRYLYLYQNSLTGSVPVEIGHLPNLLQLELQHNFLTGNIVELMSTYERLSKTAASKDFLADNCLEYCSHTIPGWFGKQGRCPSVCVHSSNVNELCRPQRLTPSSCFYTVEEEGGVCDVATNAFDVVLPPASSESSAAVATTSVRTLSTAVVTSLSGSVQSASSTRVSESTSRLEGTSSVSRPESTRSASTAHSLESITSVATPSAHTMSSVVVTSLSEGVVSASSSRRPESTSHFEGEPMRSTSVAYSSESTASVAVTSLSEGVVSASSSRRSESTSRSASTSHAESLSTRSVSVQSLYFCLAFFETYRFYLARPLTVQCGSELFVGGYPVWIEHSLSIVSGFSACVYSLFFCLSGFSFHRHADLFV